MCEAGRAGRLPDSRKYLPVKMYRFGPLQPCLSRYETRHKLMFLRFLLPQLIRRRVEMRCARRHTLSALFVPSWSPAGEARLGRVQPGNADITTKLSSLAALISALALHGFRTWRASRRPDGEYARSRKRSEASAARCRSDATCQRSQPNRTTRRGEGSAP